MLQQSSSIACHPGQEGTRNCNYGRLCGSLSIGGRDVGNILISEGLAHPYICGATSCPPPAPVVLSQGSPERLFRRLRNAVLVRSAGRPQRAKFETIAHSLVDLGAVAPFRSFLNGTGLFIWAHSFDAVHICGHRR
jgi:hypothetical protein